MSGPQEVSELLLILYRAARELPTAQFQDAALHLVKPLVEFDSAQWGSGSHNPKWISKRHVHLHREPDDAAAVYEEVKEQDDAVKLCWTMQRGVIGYNIPELMNGKSRSGIRAYAKRIQHENVLIAFDVDTVQAFTKWISLYRAEREHRFTDDELALVRILEPHLWEALAINRLTNLQHLANDDTSRKFDLGICDREGHVLHMERGFHELLQEEFGGVSGRRIPAICIDALLRGDRFLGRKVVIQVAQQSDVMFLKARAPHLVDRLSSRERQIARQVAEGWSHKEIAAKLGIAPATARNHIQAIHGKLEVHNAAEMAAALNSCL